MYATDYYVSTSGSDTSVNGSQKKPWLTVSKAFATVVRDKKRVIHIGSGTFVETATLSAPSGWSLRNERSEMM